MKRLFFTVCLLAGVVSFSACGGGDDDDKDKDKKEEADKVKPTITYPVNADGSLFVFDLGETEANLLEGVTAKDDVDGNITSSVKVSGNLERVGRTQLKYKVSDKAGNVAEVTRDVIISAKKLAGRYATVAKPHQGDTSLSSKYTMIVDIEHDTVLKITSLHYLPDVIRAKFAGDYSFKMNEMTVDDPDKNLPTISGTLSFGTKADNYKIASVYYKFTYTLVQKDAEIFSGPCTPK